MSRALKLNQSLILAWAGAILLVCLLVPGNAYADLDADITAALTEICDALNGIELPNPSVDGSIPQPPIGPTIDFTFTAVGFALCDPADKWADPALTPEPPFNSYGCENLFDVAVDVIPAGTTADVILSFDNFFFDFEMIRDYGVLLCFEGSGARVESDGYMLGGGTLAMTFAVDLSAECPTLTLTPGSVQLDLNNPDLQLQDDSCVEGWGSVFTSIFTPLVEVAISEGMETFWASTMGELNDMICAVMPTTERSWSSMKSAYH